MTMTPQSNCNQAISGNGPSPSSNPLTSLGGNSAQMPPHQLLPQQQQQQQQPPSIQAATAAGTVLNSPSVSQATAKNNSFLPVSGVGSGDGLESNWVIWTDCLVVLYSVRPTRDIKRTPLRYWFQWCKNCAYWSLLEKVIKAGGSYQLEQSLVLLLVEVISKFWFSLCSLMSPTCQVIRYTSSIVILIVGLVIELIAVVCLFSS